MTATLAAPASAPERNGGATAARRAVLRWAWRLFRKQWRQQILVLQLLTLAVAATVIGAGVATNTPPPRAAGFGSADHLVSVRGAGVAAEVQRLRQHFGTVDVIEEQPLATGDANGAWLRAQDPGGAYGRAMLALVSGRYPTGGGQVAMTRSLADTYGLHVGDLWHGPGGDRSLVGLVENPQNLLDVFALVAPGTLTTPSQASVLFDADRATVASYAFPSGERAQTPLVDQGIDPTLIILSIAILGLVFVGLVAVAGFSVLAQRRLRALSMLSAVGAEDRHVRLVLIADGAAVGLAGGVAGVLIGVGAWLGYRPRLESVSHHRIPWTAMPWWLVATSLVLAVVTTVLAARRPARTATRTSIAASLSARPSAPRAAHRSAIPGLVILGAGLVMMFYSGGWGTGRPGNTPLQLGGLLGTSVGLLLVAPACVTLLGGVARYVPAVPRLALRDLARYRARSGAALAAVSFAVFLAMLVGLLATGRYSDALDYAGPNLSADEMLVRPAATGEDIGDGKVLHPKSAAPDEATMRSAAAAIAQALGSDDILALQDSGATVLQGLRGDPGTIWVATAEVLRHYGIDPAAVSADTDLITSRDGLGKLAGLHLVVQTPDTSQDLAAPKIQRFAALPTGASEPNLLITGHGLARLGATTTKGSWLISTTDPLSAAQINAARQLAVGSGLTVETKSDAPSLDQLRTWATTAGVLLALAVLALTVGLIRSETARDLVTLTAVGAAARTRRALTGVTAGSLGLLGAVLGTGAAYLLAGAMFRSQLSQKMSHPPVVELIAILVGLPVVATVLSWLLAGREPRTLTHEPTE
jgi:putative ABC transport system permease protein